MLWNCIVLTGMSALPCPQPPHIPFLAMLPQSHPTRDASCAAPCCPALCHLHATATLCQVAEVLLRQCGFQVPHGQHPSACPVSACSHPDGETIGLHGALAPGSPRRSAGICCTWPRVVAGGSESNPPPFLSQASLIKKTQKTKLEGTSRSLLSSHLFKQNCH